MPPRLSVTSGLTVAVVVILLLIRVGLTVIILLLTAEALRAVILSAACLLVGSLVQVYLVVLREWRTADRTELHAVLHLRAAILAKHLSSVLSLNIFYKSL